MASSTGVQIYWDASIRSLAQVYEFLESLPNDSAHPFGDKLVVKRGRHYEMVPISERPDFYTSQVSLDDVQQRFGTMIEQFQRYFPNGEHRYSIQLESEPFYVGSVDGWQAMCLTKQNDEEFYFDFEVISTADDRNYEMCSFNQRVTDHTTHTGDKKNGGCLFHGVKMKPDSSYTYYLCVVGYNHRMLKKFVNQAPCVAIIDPDTRAIRIVPCSIAAIDIGDAMFAVVAVVKYDAYRKKWYVFPVSSCNVSALVNTSEIKDAVRDAMMKAGEQASTAAPVVQPTVSSSLPASSLPASSLPVVDDTDYSVVIFTEAGVREVQFGVEFTAKLTYGNCIRMNPDDTCDVNLMGLFGPCGPCASNALGKPPNMPVNYSAIDETKLAVVVASTNSSKWLQTVASSCRWTGNVLFILQDDRPGNPLDLIKSACRTAAIMAGPCAVVLYRSVAGSLHMYRGVRWPGLFDTVPSFGTDVTDVINNKLHSFVENGGMTNLNFPVRSETSADAVYVRGESYYLSDLKTISISDMVGYPHDFADACVQMSVIYPPNIIESLSDKLVDAINAWLSSKTAALKEQMSELRGTVLQNAESMKKMQNLIGERRKLDKLVGPLVASVKGMHSVRSANTKDADINRANREAAVRANVKQANDMSSDEICEMFSGVPEWLLALVDKNNLLEALRMCNKSIFLEKAAANAVRPVLMPHHNCLYLDGETTGALVLYSDYDHPMGCPDAIAVRDRSQSAIPFPMLYCDVANPGIIHWPDVAKEQKESAIWRILLRKNLSNAPAGRQYDIKPTDKQLPFLIAHFAFGVMDELIKGVSSPDTLVWDDSVPRMLRGLMGVALSVLASGAEQPASLLWQMVKPGDSLRLPPDNEVWIAVAILRIMPYTKWPMDNVRNKAAQLIAKTIRKGVVDPVVEPLRRQLAAMQAEASVECYNKRDKQLIYIAAVWFVVKRIIEAKKDHEDDHEDELSVWGKKLLEVMPEEFIGKVDLKSTRQNAYTQIYKFVHALATKSVNWGKPFHDTVKTLTNIHTKRSAAFLKAKTALLKVMRKNKDPAKAETIRQAIDYEVLKLRDMSPRNTSVDVKHRDGLTDATRLRGDAELKRTAWSVTGNADALSDARALAMNIMGVSDTAIAGIVSNGLVSVHQEPMTPALAALAVCGDRADRANSLARSAPHLSTDLILQMAGLTTDVSNLYKDICAMMGWSDRGGAMVESLLENWRDPVQGERAAMRVLMA